MSEKEQPSIKVTDRRMFTETGELRDDYVEPDAEPEPVPAPRGTERSIEPPPGSAQRPDPGQGSRGASREPGSADVRADQAPKAPPAGYGPPRHQPQFLDLVGMLAEPAALFLGDAAMPGEEPMEDLERARLHIDLLALLEDKCQGNLSAQESTVLSDLVYRLRMRYIEKRG